MCLLGESQNTLSKWWYFTVWVFTLVHVPQTTGNVMTEEKNCFVLMLIYYIIFTLHLLEFLSFSCNSYNLNDIVDISSIFNALESPRNKCSNIWGKNHPFRIHMHDGEKSLKSKLVACSFSCQNRTTQQIYIQIDLQQRIGLE